MKVYMICLLFLHSIYLTRIRKCCWRMWIGAKWCDSWKIKDLLLCFERLTFLFSLIVEFWGVTHRFTRQKTMGCPPELNYFFLLSKIHCTHCTSITSCWFTMLPSVMTSKMTCHWCYSYSKSDISDMIKTSTLHLGILIFSGLWHPCNECNVFSKVEKKKKLAFLLAFRSSSWTWTKDPLINSQML